MKFVLRLLFCVSLLHSSFATAHGNDWLQWRGPNGNGFAAKGEKPPIRWSSNKNIVWQTQVPGRGHSSPILHGERIYLTTADKSKQTQSVLCFDRKTGKPIWNKQIHSENLVARIHQKNTHASPTIACDGQSLFVYFNNSQGVFLTRMSLDGSIEWTKRLGGFDPKYPFGFAPSPTIDGPRVIVTAESKVGFMTALDRETGEPRWRVTRNRSSYSSPIVAEVAGRQQLLLSGGNSVAGFNPETGAQLWSASTIWEVSCGTLVWGKDKVFASGGYPRAQTLCVKADGSGKILWQNNVKCYEQSMIYYDGYLYGISDRGIGYCWNGETGEEMWKARMQGPVSSSPILVNGKIYYASERGKTFVFNATPSSFDLISENQLGDSTFATPAFCDNRIYTRVAFEEGNKRQEYLICIGE